MKFTNLSGRKQLTLDPYGIARHPSPRDFIERNTFRGLTAVTRDWLFIAVAIAGSIVAGHWLAWLAAVWFIGYMQFALAESILHEASHYNLFQSRWLHHWLQFLYAWPFFQTLREFRGEHHLHHAHLLSDRDQTVEDYRIYGLDRPNVNLFQVWFVKPILLFPTWFFLRHGNGWLDRRNWLQLLAFWLPVAGLFWFSGHLDMLVLYWLIPLLWVYPIFNYWSEIEEHYNTRSHARSNLSPITNFLAHNEGHHWIHHKYPTIPFYNLPAAQRAFCIPDVDTSRGFLDTYRQLKAGR